MIHNGPINSLPEIHLNNRSLNEKFQSTIKKATEIIRSTCSNIKNSTYKCANKISQTPVYKKAYKIALHIKKFAEVIFIALGAITLLCINPIIFPVSLVAGFALDVAFEKFYPALKIIQSKALAQPFPLKIAFGIACIYTPIAPIALISSFYALRLGSELSQKTPISITPPTSTGIEE